MSTGSPHAGWSLFRKDLRQLAPLLAILPLLAMFFYLLGLINSKGGETIILGVLAYIGMPFLMALGGGALLIGQEKELRTLYWMKTIPVSHTRVIATKLAVALASLASMWSLSLLLFLSYCAISGSSRLESWAISHGVSIWDPSWQLNTLFILLCGIALSWRLQSTFVSLLLIVPLALIPGALSQLTASVLNKHGLDWILNAWLLIGIVIAGTYGWYAAHRCLAPAVASSAGRRRSATSTGVRCVRWESLLPQSQTQSLDWQFNKQNALSLSILLIAFLAVAFTIPYGVIRSTTNQPSRDVHMSSGTLVFMSFVVAGLAASWLGILSFHGDRLHNRIRFLADRGIEPSRVWRSRHTMPLCILMLASLLLMSTNPWLNPFTQPLTSIRLLGAIGIGLAYLFCFLAVYALSQWIGQWLQSPIVAAIVAPTFVAMMLSYYTYAIVYFDAPVWMVAVLLAIPMIASWRAMKRWMDGNVGLGFWLDHGAWLGIMIVLPTIPFLLGVSRVPRMPPDVRQEMLAFNSSSAYGSNWTSGYPNAKALSKDSIDVWAQLYLLRQRMNDGNSPDVPLEYRSRFVEGMNHVVYSRSRDDLTAQSRGEEAEVLLIRELKKPETRALLGEELYKDALRWLSDSKARDDARKRALKSSWNRRNSSSSKGKIGGYDLPWKVQQSFWLAYVAESRLFEIRVAHLWQLLRANDATSIASASEQVRSDWDGAYNASDKTSQETIEYVYGRRRYPGGFWRGDWERDANELYAEVSKANEGK